MATSDAVARETAWLQTSGDGLPALLREPGGGPFDIVQGYYPRVPHMTERALYVMRRRISQPRTANIRLMSAYAFHLIAWWPLLDGGGDMEAEQQALDNAVELVLLRVSGTLLDKTHGGRFLSVAENPRLVEAEFPDPEQTIPLGWIRADITYSADDPEINN